MSDRNGLRTQISGKYGPDNLGVFALKRQLVTAGLEVRHPIGDSILEYSVGFTISDPCEATTPFHESESGLLKEIAEGDVHIAYTLFGGLEGYLGESTGVEIAYALCYDKPLVLLRSPQVYSDTLSPPVKELIERYSSKITVEALDKLPTQELAQFLQQVARTDFSYGLSQDEKDMVQSEVEKLLKAYQSRWQTYRKTVDSK